MTTATELRAKIERLEGLIDLLGQVREMGLVPDYLFRGYQSEVGRLHSECSDELDRVQGFASTRQLHLDLETIEGRS